MIIIDIETVPNSMEDIALASRYFPQIDDLNSAIEKHNAKPSEATMKKITECNEELVKAASLDPMFARIASIGTIIPTEDGTSERVFFNLDEKQLLESFWNFISEERIGCCTITFNGIGFDLPMLYTRTMIHGIDIAWKDKKLRKYSDYPHYDIMQLLSYWGMIKFKSLDWWAKTLGYDFDITTCPNGSMVSKWWAAGEYGKIQDYSMVDCRKTLFVYKKMRNYFALLPAENSKLKREPNVGSQYD